MSGSVWKFQLRIQDEQIISMPEGAEVLCVAEQGGVLCMWVKVDESALPKDRTIYVRGTGHPIPEGAMYLGSAQQGRYVWHVFEPWVVA